MSTAYAQDAPATDGQAEGGAATSRVIQATVTGYATGGDGGAIGAMTASGIPTHWGTVAADWRLYPLGTKLQIEGFPNDVFTVEDSGGGVRGNIFDVWFPDLSAAVAFGTKSLRVTILAASSP
ncbi:MAG: 3D domain-containing protein [Chloroflexota bacterium]|nr:3D domain-containing protein [Chloroflexota bacterium]